MPNCVMPNDLMPNSFKPNDSDPSKITPETPVNLVIPNLDDSVGQHRTTRYKKYIKYEMISIQE